MLGGAAPACSSRWAVPGDGFFEWLAGDEQEADAVVTGLHRDFVTAVEEHERPGVRGGRQRGVQPADRLSGHFERLGGVAEFAAALYIGWAKIRGPDCHYL